MKWYSVVGIMFVVGLLIGAGIYITTNEFNKYVAAKQYEGYLIGQQEFSKNLVSTLANCQAVQGLLGNNQTITIVAKECLDIKK